MPRARRRDAAALAALLFAAALPLAAPAGARAQDATPAGGGALRIAADPPRLLLGRDGGAELKVVAPADVEELSLSTSAGKIEGLRRLPGGGFTARFRAPSEHVPQVAIVAAQGRSPRGAEDGWLAIPLSGQGDARVRAAPGSEITLTIGDRRFGPRRAGEDGVAVIPVVVPPGVREAHHGFKPIDLHVPETPLLHAVIDRASVAADRQEQVRVVAYVVAPHGAARRGDGPVFEATRGTVSATEREPGAVQAVWTLPPGRAGEERLAVRLPASPASRTVLKVEAVAGPPALVAVSFDRDALVAGADPVGVTARALDAAGNSTAAALTLETDLGNLADVRERAPGEVEARLRAGPSFGGVREARVTASVAGAGISGTRALPLRPGEAAAARFDREDGVLRTDGTREAVLRVSISDRHGNPVDVVPAVAADRGKVLRVASAVPGAFEVRYLGPAVTSPTAERLLATVGSVRAIADRILLPPGPSVVLAPSVGFLADVRGRFSGASAGIAVDLPADLAMPLRHGFDLSWRGEAGVLGFRSGAGTTVLAGASAARTLGHSVDLRASATAGALLRRGGASPAARLAVELGAERGGWAPFIEAALLTAHEGAPGTFAAAGISAGVRFGVETHGDDPHRR